MPDLRKLEKIAQIRAVFLKTKNLGKTARLTHVDKSKVAEIVSDLIRKTNWGKSLEKLKTKGYSAFQIAERIQQEKNYSKTTAYSWFIGRGAEPPYDIQLYLEELARTLPTIETVSWEAAVDSLLKKGYSARHLAGLLSKKIGVSANTTYGWMSKIAPKSLEHQKAIVAFDKEIQPAIKLPWKKAIDTLLDKKSYRIVDVCQFLMERTGCNIDSAIHWVKKEVNNPPTKIQETLIALAKELPINLKPLAKTAEVNEELEQALDTIRNSGYSWTELAVMIQQELIELTDDKNLQTITGWISLRKVPKNYQRFLINFANKLKPKVIFLPTFQKDLAELQQKGYTAYQLARLLVDTLPGSTAYGLYEGISGHRGRKPSLEVQEQLHLLNQRLVAKKVLPVGAAIDSLLEKGYLASELARKLVSLVDCKVRVAETWFRKESTPKSELIQEAIIRLDKKLSALKCERCHKKGHPSKRCPKRKIIRKLRRSKYAVVADLSKLEKFSEARKLYQDGIGAPKIAQRLGVSTPTICSWTHDLIQARQQEKLRSKLKLLNDITKLRKQGLSFPRIAEKLGITESRAYQLWEQRTKD